MLRAILLDMDGVLVDSIPSIHACINHALGAMGRAQVSRDQVLPAVGPPLEEAAEQLLGQSSPGLVEDFVGHYRARYARTAAEETLPMEGLSDVIGALATRYPLAVATSKPEVYAIEILEALGVASQFQAICGRSLDLDQAPKARSVERALAAVAAGNPAGVLMVGDRGHDVRGAAVHGVATVGLLCGAGEEAELVGAGARWILPDLLSLPRLCLALEEAQDWTAVDTSIPGASPGDA